MNLDNISKLGSKRDPEIGPYWSPSKQRKYAFSPFLFHKNYVDRKWGVNSSTRMLEGLAIHDALAKYIRTKGDMSEALEALKNKVHADIYLDDVIDEDAYIATTVKKITDKFTLVLPDALRSIGNIEDSLYIEQKVVTKFKHMTGGESALPINGVMDIGYTKDRKSIAGDWKTVENFIEDIYEKPEYIVAACLYYPLHLSLTGQAPDEFAFHQLKLTKNQRKVLYLRDYNKHHAGKETYFKGQEKTLNAMIDKEICKLLPRKPQAKVITFDYHKNLDHMFAVDQMMKMTLLNIAGIGDYEIPNYTDNTTGQEEWEYFVGKISNMTEKEEKRLNNRYGRLRRALR